MFSVDECVGLNDFIKYLSKEKRNRKESIDEILEELLIKEVAYGYGIKPEDYSKCALYITGVLK